MRTVFVNPAPKRRKKAGSTGLTVRRKRRRNAGIAPFVAASRNPLVLSNPRRKRRRNPGGKLTLQKAVSNTLANLGGAGIAVGADYFALSKIENVWGRNGARLGSALLAGAFLPGSLGAATAGAMFFPIMSEIAAMLMKGKEGDEVTEADLDLLGQDLGAMLDPDDLQQW